MALLMEDMLFDIRSQFLINRQRVEVQLQPKNRWLWDSSSTWQKTQDESVWRK
jgi:hypothetical protein